MIRHLVGVLDSLFQKHNKELEEKYQQELEQQEGEKKYRRGLGNQKNAFISEFNIFNIYIFPLPLTKTWIFLSLKSQPTWGLLKTPFKM